MAELRAFEIEGLKLWFPSGDHAQPHFHAKRKGKWELRVFFLTNEQEMFEMKWQRTPKTRISRQDKQRLREMATAHRLVLLQEWEAIHP